MKRKYKIFILVLSILLIITTIYIEVLGNKTNSSINEFISRGVYQFTDDGVEYYKVIKKYEYENVEDRIVDNYNDKYIGSIGDIYISSKDPFDFFVTEYISNNVRIGHACIVSTENAEKIIDVYGNKSKEENIVKESQNTWHEKNIPEMVVLRVKGFKEENKIEILNYLKASYNKKYNYIFLIHMENRFYCTDLCSRAYESIGFNIDGNAIITTGTSMINDNDTYPIYYKKHVNKKEVKYQVYILSEE